LTKFQEQENCFNFEHTARNYVKRVFIATQELELIEYFKQAATLHYGLMKKEALKLVFQYGKENGVFMPENWEYSESAGNMWLRGLGKRHESSSSRNLNATSLTQATSVSRENVISFLGNLNELMSRHKFSANKICNLD
jgi:hypothetical protein